MAFNLVAFMEIKLNHFDFIVRLAFRARKVQVHRSIKVQLCSRGNQLENP